MAQFVKVAKVSELPEGEGVYVEAGGYQIAFFNLGDDEIYAIDNTCAHVGGPLSEGYVEEEEVECPWHGARFDITTGEVRDFPAVEGVPSYNVRLTGDDVEVEV